MQFFYFFIFFMKFVSKFFIKPWMNLVVYFIIIEWENISWLYWIIIITKYLKEKKKLKNKILSSSIFAHLLTGSWTQFGWLLKKVFFNILLDSHHHTYIYILRILSLIYLITHNIYFLFIYLYLVVILIFLLLAIHIIYFLFKKSTKNKLYKLIKISKLKLQLNHLFICLKKHNTS